MGLSRTDLVSVLAIVAGGALGASLSLNFLLLSPPGAEPALALATVVAPVPPAPAFVPVPPPPMAPVVPVPPMVPVPRFPPVGMPIFESMGPEDVERGSANSAAHRGSVDFE